MGRQVNFYMTEADEQEFIAYIRSSGNIAIFESKQASTEIVELQELPPVGKPGWFALILWNKDCSPKPTLKSIEKQNYYGTEGYESEIIEFSRSGIIEGQLTRGRIWAQFRHWRLHDIPPSLANKSVEFEKWYERLARWVKKHSVRNSSGEYVFPDAATFLEKLRSSR